MKIYTTTLDISDNSERNILLVEAEVKFALLKNHSHICDVNGDVYSISVEGDEICMIQLSSLSEDKDESDYEDESGVCITLDSIKLIDKTINNSLRSTEPITPQQADSMLKLASLRRALLES